MRSAALLALVATLAAAQSDVLTQHNDNQRTGANLRETALNTSNVPQRFGKLWTLYADGQIAAQPLYVSGLKTERCPLGCNAVVFCTMNNTVFVYDADRKPAARADTLLWARWLGPPKPNAAGTPLDPYYTNDAAWGILSTPAIDRESGTLYAVAWNADGGGTFRLHALDLFANGVERVRPRVIEAALGSKRLDPTRQKQRAGLLLDRGVLYIGFASANENDGDAASGWVLAYDAKTLAPIAAWCSTPRGVNGGIWASGQGPAADGAGNVYVSTGNGSFDARHGNFGGSVVKLRLEGRRFAVKGYFAPCNQQKLSELDLDLGSAGPLLLAGGAELVAGGKQGRLYHMRTNRMPGYDPPPGPTLECGNGPGLLADIEGARCHLHSSPVHWKGPEGEWIYVMGQSSRLNAFPIVNGRVSAAGVKASGFDLAAEEARFVKAAPTDPCLAREEHNSWMPGGILSVSSDGARAGSGIVWALVPANGDANRCRGVKGMLMAFDAGDVTRELWRSQAKDAENSDTPDSFGLLARFVPPTIAGGKVFVATFGDREERRAYFAGKRPRVHYPARSGEEPGAYYLAVYGIK